MIRTALFSISLYLLVTPCQAANAQFKTGNQLYEWCTSDIGNNDYSFCLGYLMGSTDGYIVAKALRKGPDCIPAVPRQHSIDRLAA